MKGKIFNIQEVEAIIAGKKTMFRELIKKPLAHFNNITINQDGEVSAYNKTRGWYEDLKNIKCPYKVGQEIFVALKMPKWASRLTLRIKSVKVERLQDISEEDCFKEGVECLCGSEIADTGDYFESEYYFGELEERIRECGCDATIEDCDKCVYDFGSPYANTYDNSFEPFIEYWNSTHKKPEEKWEADPWVFVYGFEVIK